MPPFTWLARRTPWSKFFPTAHVSWSTGAIPWLRQNYIRSIDAAFWFLVLTSWLPLLAGFENIIAQINPATWYPQGAGRNIAIPRIIPFATIAIATLLLGLSSQGRRWLIAVIVFVPSFLATLLAGLSDTSVIAPEANILTLLYLLFVLISMVTFVWFAHVRSIYFGIFLILALIEAASALIWDTPILTFGLLFRTYALSIVDVFFLCVVIIFGRFLVHVIQQNAVVLSYIWRRELIPDIAKSLWLWIPMLVIFLSFNVFWNRLEVSLDGALGALMVQDVPNAPANPSLEEALKFTSKYVAIEAAKKSQDGIKATDAKAQMTVADIINSSLPEIRASFPPYLMKPSNCRWYDILCHVMNGIKAVVNSVYRKARDAALNEIERQARASQQLMQKRGAEAVVAANQQVEIARTRTVEFSSQATTKVFETARQIAFLLAIYSIVMLIKTYFIVLSRVVFRDDAENGLVATLRTPWKSVPATRESPVEVTGDEFTIHKSEKTNFYVATSFEVRNAVPNVSLPQPMTSLVGRLFSGRYVMGFVNASKLVGAEATVVVNSPNELVKWTLREGDEMIVRHRHVVAFSQGTRLATEINVSLPALIFGRFIFHKFIGPGQVVVRTDGKAVAGRDRDTDESRRPTALKAWDTRAGFQIQSNLDIKGMYLASYNVRKQKRDDLIYDTAAQTKPSRTLGLASMIRIFLMPF